MRRNTLLISSLAVLAGVSSLVYFTLPPAKEIPGRVVTNASPHPRATQASDLPAASVPPEAAPADSAAQREVRELQQKLAIAESKASEPKKPKPLLADPAMRKVMQAESRSGVERGVKALLNSGLAAELQLTPEQEDALRELLVQRGSVVWDQIMIPMAAGELDGPRMAAAGRAVKQMLERSTAQIQGLLGRDGYALYERYEKTQPDRDALKQIQPKFVEAGLDLDGAQQSELLRLMSEQRANFALQDFGDPLKIDYGKFEETFSEENTNRYFHERQRYHERLVQEAQRALTPEQTALLRNLLAAELQRAKFTVRTTKAMMGQTR